MSHRRNVIISFLVSISVHVLLAMALFAFLMSDGAGLVPVFKQGASSVMVTLVPSKSVEVDPESQVEARKEPAKKDPDRPQSPPVKQEPVRFEPVKTEAVPVAAPPVADEGYASPDNEMLKAETADDSEREKEQKSNNMDNGVETIAADAAGLIEIHPRYPMGSILRGEEGVVIVKVVVNSNGRAEKIEISKSSGYSALDDSAVSALKSARFVAKNGGAVRSGEVVLPFRFKLIN